MKTRYLLLGFTFSLVIVALIWCSAYASWSKNLWRMRAVEALSIIQHLAKEQPERAYEAIEELGYVRVASDVGLLSDAHLIPPIKVSSLTRPVVYIRGDKIIVVSDEDGVLKISYGWN